MDIETIANLKNGRFVSYHNNRRWRAWSAATICACSAVRTSLAPGAEQQNSLAVTCALFCLKTPSFAKTGSGRSSQVNLKTRADCTQAELL